MRGLPAAGELCQLFTAPGSQREVFDPSVTLARRNMQVVQDRYARGVQECFRRFDEDNSGSLGSSELRGALKSLGLAVTSTQAAALVGRYDDDGSSELSVDEFNALVVSILQLQEQESAAAVTLQARRRGMSARRLSSELGARLRSTARSRRRTLPTSRRRTTARSPTPSSRRRTCASPTSPPT